METTVNVAGREVKLKATALAPRIYRFKFGRDIFQDIAQLYKSYQEVMRSIKTAEDEQTKEETQLKQLSILDLTIFENLAWVFARQGDPENVPDNPDDWLDSFEGPFSIYEILPVIIDLWNRSSATRSTPAKK